MCMARLLGNFIQSEHKTRFAAMSQLQYLQNKLHFLMAVLLYVALQSIPKFANVILVSVDFHVKFGDFVLCLFGFISFSLICFCTW